MKRSIVVLISMLLIVFAMTACGSNDDVQESSTDNETEVSTEEQSEPEASDSATTDQSGSESGDPAMATVDEAYAYPLKAIREILDTGDGDWGSVPNDIGETIGQAGTDEIFYATKDLNGDGIDELLIGYRLDSNSDISVGGLYTIKDGLAYMPEVYMFGTILADGTINVYGSSLAQQTEQFLKLGANGAIEMTEPATTEEMSFDWIHI